MRLGHPVRLLRVNTGQIACGLGIAALITLATALATHLIGTGRAVPQALTDGFRLGYYGAAGLAAAAVVATFALRPKAGRGGRRVTRGVQVAVAFAAIAVCFVGTDFAAGLSNGPPIGAYTLRGAYTFVSAPALHPPIIRPDVWVQGRLASGDIFIANTYNSSSPETMVGQSGPLILDQRLSPVWFKPVPENDVATNLSLQIYDGRPVLAWWQGNATGGEYVVVDQHYRVVARLRGADGWGLTLHDIAIRGDDAWVTAAKKVPVDLSRYGGARNGVVADSAVQEYSLRTGKLVWNWDALAHIPLSDTWAPVGSPWDAYHLNSIDLPGDGSFVISMRNTWAAYKVDIASGKIEWTLGGKHSSFTLGSSTNFEWQHDVTVYPGTPFVTLFDNHCCQLTVAGNTVAPTGPSRGLVLKVNWATHTATLADQYAYATDFDSEYMGSIQPLLGGNEFVGWGSQPRFSEYTASGRMVLDAALPDPDITYRAKVEPWVGLPLYPPSGAAQRRRGTTIVYASWNGATQVASWRVLAGSSSLALAPATTASKIGFETPIAVPARYRAFRVQALDARGQVLSSSAPFGIEG